MPFRIRQVLARRIWLGWLRRRRPDTRSGRPTHREEVALIRCSCPPGRNLGEILKSLSQTVATEALPDAPARGR
jgi:hypothetical protein